MFGFETDVKKEYARLQSIVVHCEKKSLMRISFEMNESESRKKWNIFFFFCRWNRISTTTTTTVIIPTVFKHSLFYSCHLIMKSFPQWPLLLLFLVLRVAAMDDGGVAASGFFYSNFSVFISSWCLFFANTLLLRCGDGADASVKKKVFFPLCYSSISFHSLCTCIKPVYSDVVPLVFFSACAHHQLALFRLLSVRL